MSGRDGRDAGRGRSAALRRVSLVRTAIFVALLVLAVAAFSPFLGPLRILFRFALIAGVVALALSYLWPWLRRFWR